MDETGRLTKATHLTMTSETCRKSSIFCPNDLTYYLTEHSLVYLAVRFDTANIIPLLLPSLPLGPLNMVKDPLMMSVRTG